MILAVARVDRLVQDCAHLSARLNPESPGLKRLVEIAHACEPVDLIALKRFGLEDAWLQPGERFQCERRAASDLIRAGFAERS
jgi:hypothetical protein